MAKCRHYNICGLEADSSTGLCILHSKDPEKPLDNFNEALARHREARGDNFVSMVFPDVVVFSHTTAQRVYFDGATFTQEAIFTGTTFTQGANFMGATFLQRAYFARATITQTANFTHATFMSEVNFQEARFAGKVWLRGSRFHGRALFTGQLENGQTIPIFKAQEVDFRDVIFGSDIIFRHADFQKCRFLNTDLRQVHLVDITWARKKPRFTLARRKDTKWYRLCLYDEIAPLNPGEKRACGQLETLYRPGPGHMKVDTFGKPDLPTLLAMK